MLTCTASTAAIEIGATPVRSPGAPPRPNELLNDEPSTVMLFSRLSTPPNDMLAPACGVSLTNDSRRFEIVGSVEIASRLTAVPAPVRSELKIGSALPETVTVSAIATVPSVSATSARDAEAQKHVLRRSAAGSRSSVGRHVVGPPTRMPWIENRPSACVKASYVDPDGSCTAVTVAPGTASPWASFTMPAMELVVTPCAETHRARPTASH